MPKSDDKLTHSFDKKWTFCQNKVKKKMALVMIKRLQLKSMRTEGGIETMWQRCSDVT